MCLPPSLFVNHTEGVNSMKDKFVVDVYEVDDCGNALDLEVTVDVDGTGLLLEWQDWNGDTEYLDLELEKELDRRRLEEYVEDSVISFYTERSYLN